MNDWTQDEIDEMRAEDEAYAAEQDRQQQAHYEMLRDMGVEV